MRTKKENIYRWITILCGCSILALSINIFLEPNNLVLGGVTGLGIILDSVFKSVFNIPFPIWLSNIVINLPLFIVGYKVFGFKFMRDTTISTLFLSFMLKVTENVPAFNGDMILVSVFGALFDGVALGLIIRSMCSTGGTDLLAIIINKFSKSIPISKFLLAIDFTIIFTGIIVFGINTTLYAIISVFLVSKIVGTVIDGFEFAKEVIIISDKQAEIGNAILNIIARGATSIYGKGMYTKNDKNIIFCVVKQNQIPVLKETILNIDKGAFVVISNASEVIGRGFKDIL